MRKNMTFLGALLLVGAASMMTAGAQNSGTPTLAVFVVGMDNTLGNSLATELGTKLTSGGRYALTSVSITGKRDELRAAYTSGGSSSIDRNALAAWGHDKGISAICLVVDDVKGSDNLFSAQLIDTKDSKLDGKGSYVRTGVVAADVARIALTLSRQLMGPERVARKDVTPQQKWFEPEMVFVQGGTYQMGYNSTVDCERTNCAEKNGADGTQNYVMTQHLVQVPSFRIGKYEVTQELWRTVMAGTGKENIFLFGGNNGVYQGELNSANCGNVPCDDQRPVESISWFEAVQFCNLLSTKANRTPYYNVSGTMNTADGGCPSCSITVNANANGYRLPTEEEWEYAARGCKADQCESFKYSGNNTPGEVGWQISSSQPAYSKGGTNIVGLLKPNGLGIYDMSSNVEEWCYNCWRADYTSAENCNTRATRGGNFNNTIASGKNRIVARNNANGNSPAIRRNWLGLRVVLPAQ